MHMDTETLLCIIEVLGALLVVAIAALSRHSATLRRSLAAVGQTTRATRPQWASILAGVVGANLGYVILVGAFILVMQGENPADASNFLIPAAAAAYLMCGFPAYIPLGAVCGLLVYRYAQRKSLAAPTGLVLSLAISSGVGALVAIPVYVVGLIGAAL